MCGGVGFDYQDIPKAKLKNFFSAKEMDEFEETGQIQSFYWLKKPVLPVKIKDKVDLVEWGNRDKKLRLPRTGWARVESIKQGKWAYLRPTEVLIPAKRGYEKRVWFDIAGKGLKGILVANKENKRVYLMTKEATKAYEKLTNHDRQPIEI